MKDFLAGRAKVEDVTEQREQPIDVATILENLVQLDQLLDEGSRRELRGLPYLELSKHLRIKRPESRS